MLPPAARLRHRSDFVTAMRRGRRAGSRTVVVHMFDPAAVAGAAQVGIVVSRAVGNAVVRNRVKRRLRALLASRLSLLPVGATLVVRAQPAAAEAASRGLAVDLDTALRRVVA